MAVQNNQNTEPEGYPRTVEGEPDTEPFDHEETMTEGWAQIQSWRQS